MFAKLSLSQKFIKDYANDKSSATVYFWLGEIKMLYGDNLEAKAYYQKAFELLNGTGRTPEILLKLAVIAYQADDQGQGDHFFDILQKSYPSSTAAHMARAQKKKYALSKADN